MKTKQLWRVPSRPENLLTQRLDEVLNVMNEKEKIYRSSDCKNPDYAGIAVRFSWLPGYVIKLGIGRIAGGEKLRSCIQKNNLYLLEVPKQIFYPIPQSHQSQTRLKNLCICQYVEGKQGRELLISRSHVQQLVTLIQDTGIGDMKWRNLVHTPYNTIALVDTEIESFWGAQHGLAMLREWNTLEGVMINKKF